MKQITYPDFYSRPPLRGRKRHRLRGELRGLVGYLVLGVQGRGVRGHLQEAQGGRRLCQEGGGKQGPRGSNDRDCRRQLQGRRRRPEAVLQVRFQASVLKYCRPWTPSINYFLTSCQCIQGDSSILRPGLGLVGLTLILVVPPSA